MRFAIPRVFKRRLRDHVIAGFTWTDLRKDLLPIEITTRLALNLYNTRDDLVNMPRRNPSLVYTHTHDFFSFMFPS